MQALLHTYLQEISALHSGKKATEHSYRPCLQKLMEALIGKTQKLTNEPKRRECGAPDYILEQGETPIGFIETKDIGTNLDKLNSKDKDQQQRYLKGLDNLIYTDYLEFRLYRQEQLVSSVKLGELSGDKVVLIPQAVDSFISLIREFSDYRTQTIRSPRQLAEMMARKAILIKDVFIRILQDREETGLHRQYKEFKRVLLHGVGEEEFADIYAETLAYGLFTARLHDPSSTTFSRAQACDLIPKSNPFLRQLFNYVSKELDPRAIWAVDALCDIFRATEPEKLLKSFNRGTGREDPFLHFYETFLGEYNPKKKKSRGVWYTPEAVVRFIVRSVDEVLQTHFHLPGGLADSSKITTQAQTQDFEREEREMHRVQILDTAAGTGTFLAEVISQIHEKFKDQQGLWSGYVEQDLIPRVHGFEIIMASYAMAHMKLELLLKETGYTPKSQTPRRLSVYLTNSLEKAESVNKMPYVEWFTNEANEANAIKAQTPIMVTIGNPPYLGESQNTAPWIMQLMKDYKKEPGETTRLKEKNPKWINDDYAKFIRLGEHFIEKKGEGILGYITSHSYLDNPTFRGMRHHLLSTFDEIYILDLHGNAKKKERAPDGGPDKNIFDIQQGVAILIAVKTSPGGNKPLAALHHAELYGTRESKYQFLGEHTLDSVSWRKVDYQPPFYFFMPKNMEGHDEYREGFGVNELFPVSSVGLVTARDELVIDFQSDALLDRATRFMNLPAEVARHEFNLGEDVRDWKVDLAQQDLKRNQPLKNLLTPLAYRPFDTRYTLYTGQTRGFMCMPRKNVMRHLLGHENVGLLCSKAHRDKSYQHVSVTNNISEAIYLSGTTGSNAVNFPLWLYEESQAGETGHLSLEEGRKPNLNQDIWATLKQRGGKAAEDPQSVFDYVYGLLHAPEYRRAYAEFLKSDFPRIPYPKNEEHFERLAALGGKLRALHLMRAPEGEQPQGLATFPIPGSDQVDKVHYDYENGRVWMNETQYFDRVPLEAWEFYIGGYQVAHKWLKDRQGRTLTHEEITHYQRIIAILSATLSLMQEVDKAYKEP